MDLSLNQIKFSSLPHWNEDDHSGALAAFKLSALEILQAGRGFLRKPKMGGQKADWLPACHAVQNFHGEARVFFETYFQPYQVQENKNTSGLMTGYYEAEATGDRTRTDQCHVPVYQKPPELIFLPDKDSAEARGYGMIVDGQPKPYFSRRQIEEEGVIAGRGLELVWLTDWTDCFFIHIQGSGRVHLPDGTVLRLAFAGKNGHPYTPIGRLLTERGQVASENMSMQTLRDWIARQPEAGLHLMRQNASFIFFRMAPIENPALGPPGAQQVQLTPWRSIAVDRTIWSFGTPFFIESELPKTGRWHEPFSGLVIAQDTGSAIKGGLRADLFCGAGNEAAYVAGHLKSPARFTVFLPRDFAK